MSTSACSTTALYFNTSILQMAPKIPPEIYDLLIEALGSGLSSDQYMERWEALRDLQACTNTSRPSGIWRDDNYSTRSTRNTS